MDNKILSDRVYTSERYRVTVCEDIERETDVYIALLADGTKNNIDLPPDIFSEYDGLGMGTKTLKTYYASFEFKKSVVAQITFPAQTKAVAVKPEKYKDKISFENGIATIKTDSPLCVYLQPDGDIFGGIHVFCNKKYEPVCDKKNYIEFKNGIYTADNCEYIRINEHGAPVIDSIPSDTLVYISHDAVVNASIVLKGVQNVKICGSGMLSTIDRCHGADEKFAADRYWGAFRYNALPNIYIRSGCNNVEIDGTLLNCEFRGIVIRNSQNIRISNVKMFTSTENADGINCYNTSHLTVDGCYIQSADDCFCMYNSCDSIPALFDEGYDNPSGVCEDVEVKNCIMSSNARPVVLGGHATGSKSPRCLIQNIRIHDLEIIETPYRIFGNTEEYSMYWSGFMRILSQSEQLVRNITFENININVTKGHNGKIVHIEVRAKNVASYTETQGYRIENITFKNISVCGSTEKILPSVIKSRVSEIDGCGICNVNFENVTLSGEPINDSCVICEGTVSEVNFNQKKYLWN